MFNFKQFMEKYKDLKEITSDKIYMDSQKTRFDSEGLMSEQIFGPIKSYNCACGKISVKILSGKTCPNCGVKCASNDLRYKTFAKIKFPFPVIDYLNKKKFQRLTTKYNKNILNPVQFDLTSTSKLFLQYELCEDRLTLVNQFKEKTCVPLLITGNFSLFLALYVIYELYVSKEAEKYLENFFLNLLVLPPGCRQPFIKDNNNKKEIINNSLDEIYISILRHKKYKETLEFDFENKIIEYSKMIITSIETENYVPLEDSDIILYDKISSSFQYYCDLLYENILELISGKNGLVRFSFLGKSIDFSGRAVVITDPSLNTHEIKIPKLLFFKLYILEYYRFLRQYYGEEWKTININRLMRPIRNSEFDLTGSEISKNEKFNEFCSYIFSPEVDEKIRIVFMNRQPTLWRYGLVGMLIVGLNDSDVISVSNSCVAPFTMDFDGDSAAIYRVNDKTSINEVYNNAYLKNLIFYEHNGNPLHTILNESDYAFNILKSTEYEEDDKDFSIINDLKNIRFDENISIQKKYLFKNQFYSYGIILLNSWCEFDNIFITKNTTVDEVSKLIYKNVNKDSERYHFILNELNRKLNWFLTIYSSETLTIPFEDGCKLLENSKNNFLIHNLPKNPHIGYHIYSAISDKFYNNIDKNSQLYKLTKSKFKKVQFSKSLLNIGYLADSKGKVIPNPVNGNVFGGLNEDLFFETSFGTRKALVDKIKSVPESGYAQRTFVVNLSPLEIVEDDCHSKFTFDIEVKDIKHAKSLIHRYHVIDGETKELLEPDIYNIVGKNIRLRSPITCMTDNYKICKKCVGNYNFTSPYIGILAGQYLEERLTQTTMNSHHLSGAASLIIDENIKNYFSDHLINIYNQENSFSLEFDQEIDVDILNILKNEKNYKFNSMINNKLLKFDNYNLNEEVINEDASKISDNVGLLLKSFINTKANKIPSIDTTYYLLINEFFKISNIYTIFIEILLANSHVNKNNILYRYCLKNNLDRTIWKRYSIKSLNRLISKILSWLYEPNKTNIRNFYTDINLNKEEIDKLSVFEKIWIDKF